MLKDQGDSCAICKKHSSENGRRLAIDHCHTTGKIRGLLCARCNQAIGHFKDNITTIKQALKYLASKKP